MPHIILASSSPYRKALLDRLGLKFDTVNPRVDESPLDNETPAELVARLAEAKAHAVAAEFADALIIGSDQVAVLGQHILGKPGSHDGAVAQLHAASGKTVDFLTGLCVLNSKTGQAMVKVVPYSVKFRPLTAQQIEQYLLREQPYDCAGSFKSEGLGICLFESMRGDDPNALIGLPLIELVSLLQKNGMEIL